MKLKYKFTLALSLILISLGLTLNLLIRQVLVTNMENSINNSLKEIMSSTSEYIKYTLAMNFSAINEEGFRQEAPIIVKYISLDHQCDSEVTDMKGNIIQRKGNNSNEAIVNKGTQSAIKGKAVVNLHYSGNEIAGVLSYPIYIDGNYLGIVNISKDYSDIYSTYRKTISLISFTEVAIFLCIFILAYFITNKITTPVAALTKAVKQVGEGNYNVSIKAKGKDEVGILSKEFLNMKDKINEQIQTIRLEKEKVEKLEKGRRQFFNNVTHELKTPLTAISGYAEMMLEGIVKDEEFNKRAIERIYSESDRLNKLVLDLIDVSKGVSFVGEERKPIAMCKLLNQICDDMSIKAKKYSLQITREIEDGVIYGQNDRIRELIINVIDNAIKYSVNGEEIIVRSKINEDYYELEVENTGEPIPEEIYNHIFDPFVKSDKSKEKESRGLGLYICSEIVREHDGQIILENGEKITAKIKIPHYVNNLATS